MNKEYINPVFQQTTFNCVICKEKAEHSWFDNLVYFKELWEIKYALININHRKGYEYGDINEKLNALATNYKNRNYNFLDFKEAIIERIDHLTELKKDKFSSIGAVIATTKDSINYSICSKCKQLTYWLKKGNSDGSILHPHIDYGIGIEPNQDMGEECVKIFNEASIIFKYSPKAAGALLRVVLERILREYFNTPNKMLGAIVKDPKIEEELGQFLVSLTSTLLKTVWNKACHSWTMIYDEDDKNDIKDSFILINEIVEKLITIPKRLKDLGKRQKKE